MKQPPIPRVANHGRTTVGQTEERPPSTTPNREENAQAQPLSRVALFEQKMAAIYADVQSRSCKASEATDRVVEAVLARSAGRFTARGRAGLEAYIRKACAYDRRLRCSLTPSRRSEPAPRTSGRINKAHN